MEESLAREESRSFPNNSATRWLPDVPLVIPEIKSQTTQNFWRHKESDRDTKGLIVTKPNCSIKSYVPALTPARFGSRPSSSHYISGAGKRLVDWPEMVGNVIPYIGGEEEKSEREPLKIWGA